MPRRIKDLFTVPLAVDPNSSLGDPAGDAPADGVKVIVKGHTLTRTENLSADAIRRRAEGQARGIINSMKRRNGDPDAPADSNATRKAKKVKLKYTIAKELIDIQNKYRRMADIAADEINKIITDEHAKHSDKIAAVAHVMDRAYGKSTQVNVNANTDPDSKPKELSPEQLTKRIADAIKRVEAATGRIPETPASEDTPPDIRFRH
jgi:hypothetical protein